MCVRRPPHRRRTGRVTARSAAPVRLAADSTGCAAAPRPARSWPLKKLGCLPNLDRLRCLLQEPRERLELVAQLLRPYGGGRDLHGLADRHLLLHRLGSLGFWGRISAGIFAFTLSWNEFIYALAFIQSAENKTVPVAVLTQLVEGDVYHWGSLMAGALLGSIPVALFYSFFVEYYVSSLTGAVKE
ncbi:MAG: hypothetical protein WAS21_33625 [Geminicoccaceae bacterium]